MKSSQMVEMDPKEIEDLRELFPHLQDAEVIERESRRSYNDGGSYVTHRWKLGDQYFQTEYNDWCLKSQWTKCWEVERVVVEKVEWHPVKRNTE